MNPHASQVIDAIGGTAEVARLCEIKSPSVSDWRKEGIPPARMQYLRSARRKQLKGIDLKAATAPKKRGKRPTPVTTQEA